MRRRVKYIRLSEYPVAVYLDRIDERVLIRTVVDTSVEPHTQLSAEIIQSATNRIAEKEMTDWVHKTYPRK